MPTKHTKVFEKIATEEYLKYVGYDISDIEHPDPPDSIITLKNGKTHWIEVSSIYRKSEFAKRLNSDTVEKSYPIEYLGTQNDEQKCFINGIIFRIETKDTKSNYKKFTHKYGKGVLVLYIDDPLAAHETIDNIINIKNYNSIKLNNFHSVFFYVRPTYIIMGKKEFLKKGIFKLI